MQVDALVDDPLVRSARAVVSSGAAAARAAVVTQVETDPPLALHLTATPDPVGLGDIITYSVTVTNTGGADAAGLVVDLRVPEGLYSTSGCQAVLPVRRVCAPTLYWLRMRPVVSSSGKRGPVFSSVGT